jgi:hypothetical protein
MYMIYQQVTSAVKSAYAGKQNVVQQVESARMCRQWLESLEIEPDLRSALVEPIRVLEEAFHDLLQQHP